MNSFNLKSFLHTAISGPQTPITIRVKCNSCQKIYELKCYQEDLERWRDGDLIQRAMPYLSVDDRELLISQTCGKCFDEMFK